MDINIDNLPEAANGAVHLSDIPDISVIAVSMMGAGLILFVLFVLPVWLFLHYRSRTKHLAPPPVVTPVRPAAYEDLAELARIAERIEHRLDAVETLMDAENPRWRN
ncbi:MAG: hypothetical protein Q7J29_09450 [Stagnimonas sp.]|nr:hypothetical protein [Stagnimonas sp.]